MLFRSWSEALLGEHGPLAMGLLVALGGGLLVGLERERRKGEGHGREAAGLRSFALVSVVGALAQCTRRNWFPGRATSPETMKSLASASGMRQNSQGVRHPAILS